MQRILLAAGALVLGGGILTTDPARAWHHGVPHGYHHGGDEEVIFERRHRRGGVYVDEGHHRPRHHRHCREIEYHDHHGRHRIRKVCD